MKLAFSLLLLLTVGFTAFVTRGPFSANYSDSTPDTISSTAQQATSEHGPVRMIRFVLLHDGIYPRQMRVDQGLLNIALEDKTDGSEGLLIESVIGDQRAKITQISRADKHWRGRALVRLTPGRYVVSDASQPSRQAELIVNP